jgi:hypothetical protein
MEGRGNIYEQTTQKYIFAALTIIISECFLFIFLRAL